MEAARFRYSGDPSAVILAVIGNGDLVNGQRLVLHLSRRSLLLTRSKLRENYGWESSALNAASEFLIDLVSGSGGVLCRDQDVRRTIRLPGLTDQEDVHRYSEAAHCGAKLILTDDAHFLQANDPNNWPQIIKPREFVSRLRWPQASPDPR